jgi:hypothetical protein
MSTTTTSTEAKQIIFDEFINNYYADNIEKTALSIYNKAKTLIKKEGLRIIEDWIVTFVIDKVKKASEDSFNSNYRNTQKAGKAMKECIDLYAYSIADSYSKDFKEEFRR